MEAPILESGSKGPHEEWPHMLVCDMVKGAPLRIYRAPKGLWMTKSTALKTLMDIII